MVEDVSKVGTRNARTLRFSLKSLFVFAVLVALLLAGWGIQYRETKRAITAAPAFKLANLPAEMTVKQRSTTVVPGSNGELLVTLDDITRGQVIASLATASGQPVLPPQSMSPNDVARFRIGMSYYSLKLSQLNNSLIGEDFASLIISESADGVLTEEAKIERLLAAVRGLQGAKFIRNGAEYSAEEAADHLRMKWRAASGKITTAQQFIEGVASRSSTSGEPYQIRMPDGEVVHADAYLGKVLREIE
ncbi:MAG: DUF5329 family protein [Pirellulales bacterium]